MNVFSRIYRDNAWNGIETRSGPGSHREPTRRVADAIVHIVGFLGFLETDGVLHVGCGEDSWMPDLPVLYAGCDVAPEAIAVAQRNHPDRAYRVWDAVTQPTPTTELAIIRDVIQHLSLDDGISLLSNVTGGTTWLLASTYVGTENTDIVTGDAYRPNLEAEPFNLPPALLLIHDGYEYHDGDRLRDPGKMLGLWRL